VEFPEVFFFNLEILIVQRVEKEHIANVGSFRVVRDLKLPYGDIVFQEEVEEVNIL